MLLSLFTKLDKTVRSRHCLYFVAILDVELRCEVLQVAERRASRELKVAHGQIAHVAVYVVAVVDEGNIKMSEQQIN